MGAFKHSVKPWIEGVVGYIPIFIKEEAVAVAVIDKADFELVSGFNWRANVGSSVGTRIYAVTWVKSQRVYMHRLIKACPTGSVVDHINNNPLDNRRANLEVVTPLENMRRVKAFMDGQFKAKNKMIIIDEKTDLLKGLSYVSRVSRLGDSLITVVESANLGPQVFEYFGPSGITKAKKDRKHLSQKHNIHCKIQLKNGNAVLAVFPYTEQQLKTVADYMQDHIPF